MHLVTYLEFLRHTEDALATWYQAVSEGHAADADVHFSTARFAGQSTAHASAVMLQLGRFPPPAGPVPPRMHVQMPDSPRAGAAGLLRDLLEAYQLASVVDLTWSLIDQAAQGARDTRLLDTVRSCAPEITAQLAWLRMTLRAAAPQTLLVAD